MSEFKPVKLRLKIDLVSYPTRAEGLVNMVMRRKAGLAENMERGKFPWYTHRLMHRKRVISELHDSYFRVMMIKHASPKTLEVAYSGLASNENRYWVGEWTIILLGEDRKSVSWSQDVVEKANTQQKGPSGPPDEFEIRWVRDKMW